MSDPGREARAEREAAAWFTRLSASSVSNDDVARFFTWREQPRNAAAYARMEAVFTATQDLAGDPDVEAAAIEALNRHAQARHRAPPGRRLALVGGASVLLAALVAAAVFVAVGHGRVYETGIGERRIIRLADGSTIQLNTDSRARVRLGQSRRQIELERGQAFFDVARDPARPFVVDAGGVDVTALGTRFDVRRDGASAFVTLVEGRVAVRREKSQGEVALEAGQAATAASDVAPRRVSTDVAAATSWTSGRLIFHDTPLAAAVAEVNRYSERKLRLGPGVDASARINGAFDTGDVEAFADAAAQTLSAAVRKEAGGLELRGAS